MRFIRPLTLLIALPVALLLNNSRAQEHDHAHDGHEHDQAPEMIGYLPQTEKFKQTNDALRDQLKKLRELQIRFHTADDPAVEARNRREWFEARDQTNAMQVEMLAAAAEEFREDPEHRVPLGVTLYKSLKRNSDKDCFEGMVPVAKALFDAQYPSDELAQIYLMCCLANNEYELAKQPLQELLSREDVSPKLKQAENDLEKYQQAWDEELKARERDAVGEPLPQAKIVTSKGDVIIELFENDAPEAVASFISLAERGFYDYLDFFLVIDRVAAQSGCPNEDGSGIPGYNLPDESENPTARKIFRGSIVLALLKDRKNSGGSQFYISYLPTLRPSQEYLVFGRVLSGMQTVANLNRVNPLDKKDEEEEKTEEKKSPDEIITVEILRKRDHKYEPQRLPPISDLGSAVRE